MSEVVGELPACRLRRVTEYIEGNLERPLRHGDDAERVPGSRVAEAADVAANRGGDVPSKPAPGRHDVPFVTHSFELAHGFHDQNVHEALFLRAERQPDGRRTFKLVEREPLPTSNGEDLYRRIYGFDTA